MRFLSSEPKKNATGKAIHQAVTAFLAHCGSLVKRDSASAAETTRKLAAMAAATAFAGSDGSASKQKATEPMAIVALTSTATNQMKARTRGLTFDMSCVTRLAGARQLDGRVRPHSTASTLLAEQNRDDDYRDCTGIKRDLEIPRG